MKLYLKCPNCKYENSFKSNATNRVEYAMKYKKIKELVCEKCSKKNEIPLNKIYAKESKLAYLLAGIVFVIGSFLILIFWSKILSTSKNTMGLYAVVLLLLVPVWIYIIIQEQERIRVNSFNHSYV